ncbi:MAG: major coat protein [Gammaproteobacteria bacterium]
MKQNTTKTTAFLAAIVSGLVLLATAGAANAALPAAVTAAFTDLNDDAMALVDLAWTVLIPITIAFIILRLFKRATGSAV